MTSRICFGKRFRGVLLVLTAIHSDSPCCLCPLYLLNKVSNHVVPPIDKATRVSSAVISDGVDLIERESSGGTSISVEKPADMVEFNGPGSSFLPHSETYVAYRRRKVRILEFGEITVPLIESFVEERPT